MVKIKNKQVRYISEELAGSHSQKKIRDKLKLCQKEKEEYLTQLQRARADLINYQRRQESALLELKKYGQADFIRELLLIMDSLEAGSKNQHIRQIKKQMEILLEKRGLKEIKALGQKFNPEFHEAVELVESDEESGMIIEEVQKGYLLGDKVLRVSKVKVSK